MPHRIGVALNPNVVDSFGDKIRGRIERNLHLPVESVRTADVYVIDKELPQSEVDMLTRELFVDPVIQAPFSDIAPSGDFDWLIELGYSPGSNDIEGGIIKGAVERVAGINFRPGENIYTSKQYMIKAKGLSGDGVERIAATLGRAPIKRWKITHRDSLAGHYLPIPKVSLAHKPETKYVDLDVPDDRLLEISNYGKLALNLSEMRAIKEYFSRPEIVEQRKMVGLDAMPTDAELEALAQSWSEHCKHKIFNARIKYREGEKETDIDSLFDTYIKRSTKTLQKKLPWVVSTLWDNAGGVKLNDDWILAVKCETHNSPSNEEPYGGAITGIVGVYRDPMGTGMGAMLIYGTYGFCTGFPEYAGELLPKIHPGNLLEGVREGVQDGGNKSGIPTPYGITYFHDGYMGKPAIFVKAAGLIPAVVNGKPGYEKKADPGDLIVMCGGRVGIDGIHGATESSMEAGEWITAGHVQMGDPFTQKKMHDFLIEARDLGYYKCITDNGAGGLSSSVGEMGQFSNGFELYLDRVLLKYEGLDPWQILVSESQERMTLAVDPSKIDELARLARKHEVEVSVIGKFTDSGKFHSTYDGKTVTYMDMDFVHRGVPQFVLEAEWLTPEQRWLYEPSLTEPANYGELLKQMLSRPNIAGKEYIVRQFDHEVQGTSAVKHLVGKESDVQGDAVVVKPLHDSNVGIAVSAGINPAYSRIDAYHMTANAIDEAIRRVIAVGGSLKQIPLNDNFCWPNPVPEENDPNAKYKLAQLIRANQALYDYTMAFRTPCVSGKDSMSMDGTIKDKEGESHRVSALPTLQISADGKIEDVEKCVTMDVKKPGDIVYVLGMTYDELGGSEFYELHGEVGLKVPVVIAGRAKKLYNAFSKAVDERIVASSHGCYKGGLGVALAQSSFAGGYGMDVDLRKVPSRVKDDTKVLYSESSGRFVVTVSPENEQRFRQLMRGNAYRAVGYVTDKDSLNVTGLNGNPIMQENIYELKSAWKSTFSRY